MRSEPVLTIDPPGPVNDLAELYAIAFEQADTAARQYEELDERLAAPDEDSVKPVQRIWQSLTRRERQRGELVASRCIATFGTRPDPTQLRSLPTDRIFAQELSNFANSSLSTPYLAWGIAVRRGDRAFIFWTYVAANTEDPRIRAAAEEFAREALHDCNLLRRERRLAWHAARDQTASEIDAEGGEALSAAMLESLLSKDIEQWSRRIPADAREVLSKLGSSPLPASDPAEAQPPTETLEEIKHRALRRAEQLTSLYLEEAERATNHDSLEFAQRLAGQSITRLAELRRLAASAAAT
ncbi:MULTISPECIES: hypothetical protein [Rhodopseudomonas]|uniref:Uncharacterized protein n=1 Tax=Rhodopseudomonas palustris TaxID=1076 RepID=A0A0D7E652_RHOPL|nr:MULTISPECIES: hypothetical protein [Rhodopseudomonas]KIZ35925.1 hypothetical protein OO17_25160 [Rhodopseudomonas palustris]MDF3809334.1 hypothetical protein [Rhodopseudomonas sp. BAL398]WOK16991.1 hypothetical protein RBJ75_23115 [Rhodopseudomonas sp. BAL398]